FAALPLGLRLGLLPKTLRCLQARQFALLRGEQHGERGAGEQSQRREGNQGEEQLAQAPAQPLQARVVGRDEVDLGHARGTPLKASPMATAALQWAESRAASSGMSRWGKTAKGSSSSTGLPSAPARNCAMPGIAASAPTTSTLSTPMPRVFEAA